MTLIFVYNARSGKRNALIDAGHKLFSPSTYPCSLCALTYDTFTENTVWKMFRKQSNHEMQFFHKDEFESQFPSVRLIYPTVLKLEGQQLTTVLTPEILNEIKSVEDLIQSLNTTL
ncbi:MAG: GTPase [Winogradskyella sp.]|uniref:GTPase n=1 Tax=Winogradskyella sp. TaxID=1883156 RepID=UPI0025FF8106|nr:GTPase [Winogradskyella sp.]NRB83048.1 GTPase [Winogradskyella sp.]